MDDDRSFIVILHYTNEGAPFLTQTPPAMTLSDVQSALTSLSELVFVLPDGTRVPPHFHVTEVGQVDKYFVDCGDQVRKTGWINFHPGVAAQSDVLRRSGIPRQRAARRGRGVAKRLDKPKSAQNGWIIG